MVIESTFFIGDVMALHKHQPQQTENKGGTGKLHKQERTFPAFLAFGVPAENLRHRNAGKKLPGQHAAYHKQNDYH